MDYRFLDYELSETDFCLNRNCERIPLEPKALRVLILLVSRAGRLVDKQELLESVWPGTFVEENTLTRTIAVLRRQLGDSSRDPKLIETVPTRGYRFIAAVEVMPALATVAASFPSPSPDPSREPEPSGQTEHLAVSSAADIESALSASFGAGEASLADSRAPKTGILNLRWLMLAGCLGLVAILCLWIWSRRRDAEVPIRSLAVLPLDDLSPGTREDYFADGMTDELITELARIPGLRVVSRTSIMQDKGSHKSLARIARELDVDAIVEGSVVRLGDRVRITAQLVDTRSDRHLWAQTFEESAGDILSLQAKVAREIALQTSTVLTPAAQAGLAEALVTKVLTNGQHAAEIMPSAIAAAKRAIELDPYSGEAYTALGAIDTTYLWDWNSAEQNLCKGIELSPSSSDAETWYAVYLTSVGRPAEAVNAMQRAVALDPFSFWANRLLGSMLYYSRRYDESLVASNARLKSHRTSMNLSRGGTPTFMKSRADIAMPSRPI